MTEILLRATGRAYNQTTTEQVINARLELTADDRLRLLSNDEDNTVSVIFDVSLKDINTISGYGATLRFLISGQYFVFVIPTRYGYTLPLASTLTYGEVAKDSNIEEWVNLFKQKGVHVTFKKNSTMNKIGIAITILIVLIVIVYVVANKSH